MKYIISIHSHTHFLFGEVDDARQSVALAIMSEAYGQVMVWH